MKIKDLIKKIFNYAGLEVKRYNNEIKHLSFDEILFDKINFNPVIFDVGANNGQSIERFKKIFPNSAIHSFEPIKSEYEIIRKKYGDHKNIYLNNLAVGEIECLRNINITEKSENSSFNNVRQGTNWLKTRSNQFNVDEDKFVKKKEEVKIITLDDYCKDNKIDEIDILKIDTQGYEDKVLQGSIELIKKNNIKVIIAEIILDDVYDKCFSFSELEKYLIPYNFRIVGINLMNNNLFSSIIFAADVMYFNKKHFKI